VGFAAIGRLKLLNLLQERAQSVGVRPSYRRAVKSLDELAGADLIVGADGVNSLVRRSHEKDFGASISLLTNRFAWFGTTKRFETLTQTFIETELGSFNAHHYRYAPTMSTLVIEATSTT
jgi:2-polyprenyl-6-methoxyphenol hydroxylase-like FAD-dependent oxidoreductase